MTTLSIAQLAQDTNFGLSVITAYNNGKIAAKIKHGSDDKTSVKVSYDHVMSSTENHFNAAVKCLDKLLADHNKKFEIVYYTYSEKDTGYTFIVKRID